MKVTINGFGGEIPLLPALTTPTNKAQVAEKCRFDEGNLRALDADTLWVRAPMVKTGNIKAIYRYKPEAGNPSSGQLFHWNQRTQVASGFIRGDSERAVAFTCEGDFPRITDSSIAIAGGDFPAASYRLGVPAPTKAVSPNLEYDGRTFKLNTESGEYNLYSITSYDFLKGNKILSTASKRIGSISGYVESVFLLEDLANGAQVFWYRKTSHGLGGELPISESRPLPKAGQWHRMIQQDSRLILIGNGEDGFGAATSDDYGVNWTLRTTPGARVWRDIAGSNGVLIAVTDDGLANPVARSTNGGNTWTAIVSPVGKWMSVGGRYHYIDGSHNANMFAVVAGGDGTSSSMVTADGGLTWTIKALSQKANWKRVADSGFGFFAMAEDGESPHLIAISATATGVNTAAFGSWESSATGHDNDAFIDCRVETINFIDVPGFPLLSTVRFLINGSTSAKILATNYYPGHPSPEYSLRLLIEDSRASAFLHKSADVAEDNTEIIHVYRVGEEGEKSERRYLITYESDWTTQRFEGPPAQDAEGNIIFSDTASILPGQGVLLSGLPAIGDIPNLPWKVTHVGIYRNSGTAWRRVGRVDAGVTTFLDNVAEDELGEALASTDFYPPPSDMHHIGTLNNGIAFGVTDNEVAFSYPYLPHAWGPNNRLPFDSTVVAAVSLGALIYAFTKDNPFIIAGQDPRSMYAEEIPVGYGCVSVDSVCAVGDGVVYASAIGLHLLRPGQPPVNISEGLMTRQQWRALSPHSMLCGFYEGWLLVFWNKAPNKGCLVFRLDEPDLGVVSLPDFDVSALYVDTALGALTYVKPYDGTENKAFIFQGGDTPNTAYKWRSGLLKPPRATAFTAVRIWSRDYDSPLTFRLFDEEGVLLYSHAVTSERAFRLPGGQRSMAVAVELEGTQEVMRIEIANSMSELAT